MAYVDGFIVPVPKGELDAYFAAARTIALIYREHGALSVVEALADDVSWGDKTSFPRAVQLADAETVVFSWVTFPDRAARDAANEKMTTDPRIAALKWESQMDSTRMIWGGFQVRVSE